MPDADLPRRGFLRSTVAILVASGFVRTSHGHDQPDSLPVVRISRASFQPDRYQEVRRLLGSARESLVPALQKLPGCLDYFASIDRESSTMIYASVWPSRKEAKPLAGFAPMRELAAQFTRSGVVFERPVANYETLWRL